MLRKGSGLARHESDFRAIGNQPLSLDELLVLLGNAAADGGQSRDDAIACYLSASEGWPEAKERIGGAFAGERVQLRESKAD